MSFEQYVTTALWSSNDDNDDPMDNTYDLSVETSKHLKKVHSDFWENNETLLKEALKHNDENQISHDLWLTQNGHGAGFWDRNYPDDIGEKLTQISKNIGEIYLYVGDDGMIYHT